MLCAGRTLGPHARVLCKRLCAEISSLDQPGANGKPADLLEWCQTDRKQYLALLPDLPLTGIGDLRLHPFAVHAVVGKDQQQAIIDHTHAALAELSYDLVRTQPTARLQVRRTSKRMLQKGSFLFEQRLHLTAQLVVTLASFYQKRAPGMAQRTAKESF